MTTPEVSVIIPSYNRWPGVCCAIDSVLDQSYPGVKCIVVDDASGDGSSEKLLDKYADAIVVVSNPENRGQSYSRNIGVKKASSEYLCFLDSDDVLTPDAVRDRMDIYAEDPDFEGVSFGLCVSESRGDKKHLLEQKSAGERLGISEYLQNKSWVRNNSYIIPRRVMSSIGMYNVELFNREDVELFLRLLSQVEFRFCGSIVSLVREQGDDRARDDFERIFRQKDTFYRVIERNEQLVSKLSSTELNTLQVFDLIEPLRGYYNTGKYAQYRALYRDITRQKQLVLNKRFKKRYYVSYVLQFFKQAPGS